MYRIIFKSDKANYKQMAAGRFMNREVTIFISGRSFGCIYPENICTWNGFSGSVFYNTRHLRLQVQGYGEKKKNI